MSAPSPLSTFSGIQSPTTQISSDATEVQHIEKLKREEARNQEPTSLDNNSIFSPAKCLFCSVENEDISTSLLHMRKAHGLIIPAEEHLIVDMESLLGYLHVIIFDLKECIFCHTARRTPNAVQQHMMAKGHCRVDLESDGAEMLEFYDTQAYFNNFYKVDGSDLTKAAPESSTSRPANRSSNLYLLSGRTALGRGHQLASPSRHSPSTSNSTQEPKPQAGQIVQPRQDRVADVLENRLANIRANDRSSLMHLPQPQMLSILSTSHKQMSQAQKTERRIRSRLEGKNNSTMMKHFKNDVPGPKNG